MRFPFRHLPTTRLVASMLLAAAVFPHSIAFAGGDKEPKEKPPVVRFSAEVLRLLNKDQRAQLEAAVLAGLITVEQVEAAKGNPDRLRALIADAILRRTLQDAIDIAVAHEVITEKQGEQARKDPQFLKDVVDLRANGDLLGLPVEKIREIQETYAKQPDEAGRKLAHRRLVAAGVQVNYGIDLPDNAFDVLDPTKLLDVIVDLGTIGFDPKQIAEVLDDPAFFEQVRQKGLQQALLGAVKAKDPANALFDPKNGVWEEKGGRFILQAKKLREQAANGPGNAPGGRSGKAPGSVPGFGSHSGKGSGGGRSGGRSGSSGSNGSSHGGGSGQGKGGTHNPDTDFPIGGGPATGDTAGQSSKKKGPGTDASGPAAGGSAGTGQGTGDSTSGTSNEGGAGGTSTGGGAGSSGSGASSGSGGGTGGGNGSGTGGASGTSEGTGSSSQPNGGGSTTPGASGAGSTGTDNAPPASPHGGRRYVGSDREENSDGTVTVVSYFADGSWDSTTFDSDQKVVGSQTGGSSNLDDSGSGGGVVSLPPGSDSGLVETSSDPENYQSPETAARIAATMAAIHAYVAQARAAGAGSEVNNRDDACPAPFIHGKGVPPRRLRGLLVGGDRRGDRDLRSPAGNMSGEVPSKDKGDVDPADEDQR